MGGYGLSVRSTAHGPVEGRTSNSAGVSSKPPSTLLSLSLSLSLSSVFSDFSSVLLEKAPNFTPTKPTLPMSVSWIEFQKPSLLVLFRISH
ncbi:hypothetical protein YC2023_090270 [Brassica napus]